jgi:acyl-CoA thioester hydrolase
MKPEISMVYRPCEAAKIIFDYEIRDAATKEVFVTGHSVQVFMDKNTHQLVLTNPKFYEAWRKRWEVDV